MDERRVPMPTHLTVAGTYAIDLWAVELRLSRRRAGAVLGAALLTFSVLAGGLGLEAPWALLGAGLALILAAVAATRQVDGLPLERWLGVWLAYHRARPRVATWRPASPAGAPPRPGGWARYRPAGSGRRAPRGDER
jgi:hypothetical protein